MVCGEEKARGPGKNVLDLFQGRLDWALAVDWISRWSRTPTRRREKRGPQGGTGGPGLGRTGGQGIAGRAGEDGGLQT